MFGAFVLIAATFASAGLADALGRDDMPPKSGPSLSESVVDMSPV